VGRVASHLPSSYVSWVESNSPKLTLAAEGLCLKCGLCCNGVIFADVRLQRGDRAEHLKALGLPVTGSRPMVFAQPCAALEGCRCRIYNDRPRYCREFDCLLLKRFKAGKIGGRAAHQLVATARGQAERVRELLSRLGERDEKAPLATRFRRTAKRLEQNAQGDKTARTYGELTLAFHDLSLLLSETFYPAPTE
jgi:Fe-S-cluster containining protein